VLNTADALLLMEVYPANEAPIPGADTRALCAALRARGKLSPIFVEQSDALPLALADALRDGDLLMTMGAGSIGSIAAQLPARMAEIMA
jgi:UDP-N-acetylmuramate--alanine ligase